MAVDPWLLVARFVLYVSLMLLAGLPWFVRRACGVAPLVGLHRLRELLLSAGVLGVLASVAQLGAMAHNMAGTSDPSAISAVIRIVLTQTAMGWLWVARVLLLVAALWIAHGAAMARRRLSALALLGAGALASLAWAGHGAMSDGMLGWVHLAADVMHLEAAAAWLGALAGLSWMTASVLRHRSAAGLAQLDRAASGFALPGALIVGALTVTGVANALLVIGPHPGLLLHSPYGLLLLAKLLVFAAMLGLATLNRLRLVPALSVGSGAVGTAVASLRRSVAAETALALLVLGLVAWLGMLEPA